MIRTVIADDDIEMLQGLEHIIPWEEYGFTIVGKADNGTDALKVVQETVPDLLITDITMPGLDGLELIRESKKSINPELKSVLLTCHEDFHFAKAAIELSSEDYLVKYTLTEEELIRTLLKIKAKYQTEQQQKAGRDLNLNKLLVRDNFFMNIIKKTLTDPDEIVRTAALLKINLPAGPFRTVGLFVDNQSPDSLLPELGAQITDSIAAVLQNQPQGTYFQFAANAWMVLSWSAADPLSRKSKDLALIKAIQQSVLNDLQTNLSATYIPECPAITELGQPVQEANALRESYFYLEPGAFVCAKQVFASGQPGDLYKQYAAPLKAALETGQAQKLLDVIRQLTQTLQDAKYAPSSVKSLFHRILVDIEAVAGRYGITFEDFKLTGDRFSQYQAALLAIVRFSLEKLDEARGNSRRPEIHRVIAYIDGHLGENIRCEKMAKLVNMNSSYFSRLFKTEMGVSFSDYLINRRMEVASVLLSSSDYSIDEIAKSVGIENPSYFYRVYKKTTGKTPGKVRNPINIG